MGSWYSKYSTYIEVKPVSERYNYHWRIEYHEQRESINEDQTTKKSCSNNANVIYAIYIYILVF